MLLPQEIIRQKRDGLPLTAGEIAFLVRGIADRSIGDAQVAAFAMAVLLRGMSHDETVALTLAMRDSGRVLAWPDLPGPVVDKHSTGGVGDKVSLILAPILAACGCFVPMLSGRGLGHTGGTLDKLESIPGYDTRPSPERLRAVVRDAGAAIVGQTAELAPADRRLYAIRDVTATVESIPLITASILSKKLAAGPAALVMDVKVGSGAFLPELDRARELAASIAGVAAGAGLRCNALLTDMNACLGTTAGNALEVEEALMMLRGARVEARLREVTLALAAEALLLAGIEAYSATALRRAEAALASGAAAERFQRMAHALGGPADLLERSSALLPRAPLRRPVHATTEGFVRAIDVRRLGLAVVMLGGGRTRPEDAIDHAVGLSAVAGLGAACGPLRPLALVHGRDDAAMAAAAEVIRGAYTLGDAPAVAPASAVIERIIGAAPPPEARAR
jgi:thymidine phosphorylase